MEMDGEGGSLSCPKTHSQLLKVQRAQGPQNLQKLCVLCSFVFFSASYFLTFLNLEILGFYILSPPAAHELKLPPIPILHKTWW